MQMTNIKPKLLIVEDEVYSQIYYSNVLEADYDLFIAPTVSEAKKALRDTKFKLAIVDLSLPGGEDGLSLIRYLCLMHPEITASIVISAHAYPKNREDALAAGAAEFITKPIMADALLGVVQKYIQDNP
jgi:DNA-binding NtrC family response regulator